MATRQSGGMGIDHLTVVPENLEREPSVDDDMGDTATTDAADEA